MLNSKVILLGSTILTTTLVMPIGIQAQETKVKTVEAGIEEIVVTASKRSAGSVHNIPIAVQALSGSVLSRSGATEVMDIVMKIPSLQLQDLGPGDKEYIIRGINSSGAATVGVYYDEAVITSSNAEDGGGRNADIRMYDLERIEVIKGPQGTLYGASSMSGTIRYITNKPSAEGFEGNISGETSTTEGGGFNYNLNGMLNIPISDKFAIRNVVWSNNNSGYVDAVRIPSGPVEDVNNDQTFGIRSSARLWASDDLTLTTQVTYQEMESDGSSRYTPEGTMSFGNADAGYDPVDGGDLANTDLAISPWKEDLVILSLTAENNFDTGSLTATTNYYNRDIEFSFDSSPILFFFGVPDPATTLLPQSRSILSNELRYASNLDGPFNFVIGGFYGKEKWDMEVQVITTDDDGFPIGEFSSDNADDAFVGGNTYFGRSSQYELSQKAIYGEMTYDFSDQLQAIVGARYFDSTRKTGDTNLHPFGGFADDAVRSEVLQETSENKPTYKFSLAYKPSEDLTLYTTVSEGFRVGGVNRPSISSSIEILPSYKSDSLWNYEAGFKAKLADGRVIVNGAAYTMRWSDMQVLARDATGAFTFLTNAGGAKVDGFEIEIKAAISSSLEAGISGSLQSAKLTENGPVLGDSSSQALEGNRIPNVPKSQGSIYITHTKALKNNYTMETMFDLGYRNSARTEFNPNNALDVELDAFALANFRTNISNDKWTFSVFAKNLFNTRAQIDAINGSQDPLAFLTVRPRTIGVSSAMKF